MKLMSHRLGAAPGDLVTAAARDVLTIGDGDFTGIYEEYSAGPWSSFPLWGEPDVEQTGAIVEHDRAAVPTSVAARLVGIDTLIRECFELESLRCVRLFRAKQGATVLPHRDYLEHTAAFTRIHIPLVTDERYSRNTENGHCFHMRVGEGWYLDATQPHSGGVTGPLSRTHLVLDFVGSVAPADTVRPGCFTAIDALPAFIERPPLPAGVIESLGAATPLLTAPNWRDWLKILSRVHLSYDVDVTKVYDWMSDLAHASEPSWRDLLVEDVDRMRRYYLAEGPEATESFDELWQRHSWLTG